MSDIGMILDRLGRKLVSDVAPRLEGDYSAGHANMIGFMSVMAGEAWDSAAERLNNEIIMFRGLLSAGGEDVSEIQPASLKISDLTAARDELAERIVAMQTALETRGDDAAKALNTQIWGALLVGAHARMPSPTDFPSPDET